jgi:hypothetical protein
MLYPLIHLYYHIHTYVHPLYMCIHHIYTLTRLKTPIYTPQNNHVNRYNPWRVSSAFLNLFDTIIILVFIPIFDNLIYPK